MSESVAVQGQASVSDYLLRDADYNTMINQLESLLERARKDKSTNDLFLLPDVTPIEVFEEFFKDHYIGGDNCWYIVRDVVKIGKTDKAFYAASVTYHDNNDSQDNTTCQMTLRAIFNILAENPDSKIRQMSELSKQK